MSNVDFPLIYKNFIPSIIHSTDNSFLVSYGRYINNREKIWTFSIRKNNRYRTSLTFKSKKFYLVLTKKDFTLNILRTKMESFLDKVYLYFNIDYMNENEYDENNNVNYNICSFEEHKDDTFNLPL